MSFSLSYINHDLPSVHDRFHFVAWLEILLCFAACTPIVFICWLLNCSFCDNVAKKLSKDANFFLFAMIHFSLDSQTMQTAVKQLSNRRYFIGWRYGNGKSACRFGTFQVIAGSQSVWRLYRRSSPATILVTFRKNNTFVLSFFNQKPQGKTEKQQGRR